MQDNDFSQPMFNQLPGAVVALALAIFVVEAILWAAGSGYLGGEQGVGWRSMAVEEIGFFKQLVVWMIETGNWAPKHLARFVSYPFVHWGFGHAIFAIVLLLALGKLVGEVFGNIAVLVIFFFCAFAGAFVFAGLSWSERPLVGAYPSVYGLIGAYTLILWVNLGAQGQNQYQAFTLIAFLLGINLVFDVLFGARPDFLAKIAGFCVGFLIAPFLAPGALKRVLHRLRQR